MKRVGLCCAFCDQEKRRPRGPPRARRRRRAKLTTQDPEDNRLQSICFLERVVAMKS